MTEEKRRFSRIVFNMNAELTVSGRIFPVAEMINLSVGGCQLEIGEDFPAATPCSLLIVLNPADRSMNVDVDGEIVRSDSGVVGIRFSTISPEALGHLQNIIRYNAADPDRIEKEIIDRPGLV